MSGSTIGRIFTVTTWGESHGPALGVVIDGCPAGLTLNQDMIQKDLDRRKPGQSPFATPRREADKVEILSGIFNGTTTGTPISLLINNKEQRPSDYSQIASCFRPGHADLSYWLKYNIRDHRGGGRSSGRETAARVAAGAVARCLLSEFKIKIMAYTFSIANINIDYNQFEPTLIDSHPLKMPDQNAADKAVKYLTELKAKSDSAGGVVECIVENVPSGLGEPVFDKLDANLAKAICSIGGVKAVEFGSGIQASKMTGWEHNDFYHSLPNNKTPIKQSNNAGGILGGISDGSQVKLRAHFKPTPSISRKQPTVNTAGENIEIAIKGRHDPLIVPRAVIVVEAMVALTLADHLLLSATSNINILKKLLK